MFICFVTFANFLPDPLTYLKYPVFEPQPGTCCCIDVLLFEYISAVLGQNNVNTFTSIKTLL